LHLAQCTWIRVQAREVCESARDIQARVSETTKTNERLCDQADVLRAEAEWERQRSSEVKRGPGPDSKSIAWATGAAIGS
jgi:hypothetical protein